jgi:hypothetical protein
MYESPISIAVNSFIKEQTERVDKEILYQATMQTGINIGKEELIKALRYDRDQYDKGYSDGYEEAIRGFAERLCEGRVSNDPVVIAVKAQIEIEKGGEG